MIILKMVAAEDVWFEFEDEVAFSDNFEDRVVICGNNDFISFGRDDLLRVVKEDDYYDYDEYQETYPSTLERLEKVTGKKWKKTQITGYSQSDWQDLYYIEDEVSSDEIEYLENFYMGKVGEFRIWADVNDVKDINYECDDYTAFVPDDIIWHGKKAICEYLNLDETNVKILEIAGSHTVYDYKEME